MSRSFTVEVLINAKNNAGAAFSQFERGFADALSIPKDWGEAADRLGFSLGNIVAQLPQLVMETAKLGIQSEAVTRRFTAFAGSTERAEEFLISFQKASDGTIDRMSAMEGATKLLGMGLVDNADEMETMVAIAVKMGDQTMSAGDRIRDFAMLLANQSTPRLDNFNISSGRARKLIDELLRSGQAISREQAFKMAVMQEGAKSLDILGDTSELAATKMARLQAAVKDAQVGFGEILVEELALIAGTDELAESVRQLPDAFKAWREELQKHPALGRMSTEEVRKSQQAYKDSREQALRMRDAQLLVADVTLHSEKSWAQYSWAIVRARESTEKIEPVMETLNDVTRRASQGLVEIAEGGETGAKWISELSYVTPLASAALRDFGDTQANMEKTVLDVIVALEEEKKYFEALPAFLVDTSVSFTSHFRNIAEKAQDFADKRTEIEAKHQEKIDDLVKRGQATQVQINAAAEEEKLAKLQQSLEMALLQQSEFTDKVKESTKIRKEAQIEALRTQIVEQEQLLADHHAGRLWRSGENVDALITEEQRRHDESIAILEDEMAKQEEVQRMALGRMILQAFEAWATMKGISAERMLEMRTAIMEEYGLIDAGGARVMRNLVGGWEDYADGADTSAQTVIDSANAVIAAIERMPTLKVITIETRMRTITERGGGFQEFQFGGVSRGGPALVGEAGPEFVFLPPGARVTPTNRTTNNNFNMTVNTRATTPSVTQDYQLMQAMVQ